MTAVAGNLRLLLLGPPIVEVGDGPVKLETKKASALLAYLSLRPRGLRRDSLAACFWPEYSQTNAFGNLRRTLASLNRSLPGGWFEADRDTVSLVKSPDIYSDVSSFMEAASHCRTHCGADRPPCPDCLNALEESAQLYRGEFLEGLNLPDCPDFDDWQLTQRESLKAEFGWMLQRLVQGYTAIRDWDSATTQARRWVALDRLHEAAQRALIESYVCMGQKSAAIQQYESFAALLEEELGVKPEAATLQLYNAAIGDQPAGESGRPQAAIEEPIRIPLQPFLRTKVIIPPVRRDALKRTRLTTRIDREIGKALILVSAPAGFGKTTLLASWAVKTEQPVAWVSLDPLDNDPRLVARAIVTALREIHPQFGTAVLQMLCSPQLVPLQAVLTILLNEIAAMDGQTVLVLDDYHVLKDSGAQEVITFFLDKPAATLRIVIATRSDPHLPLARLRARGELAEIRAEDLRFNTQETAAFLKGVHGLNVTAQQVAALEDRSEGWIAGLQMAAVSLQGRSDVAGFVESFGGSHRFILDYLTDEVLNRQTEDIQSFLCRTSILRRLCAPLCDAVAQRPGDSAKVLEQLERANLFLVALDDNRIWFRYHRLFADLLLARLMAGEPSLVATLHLQASHWFELNGFVEEAVEHALAAKDHSRVIRLIEQNVPLMAAGRQTHLPEWIGALPPDLLEKKPLLYLLQAVGLVTRGQIHRVESLLEQAERRIASSDQTIPTRDIRGQIAGLRAHFASMRGDVPSAIEFAELACRNLASTSRTAKLTTSYTLARAYFTTGEFARAKEELSSLLHDSGQGTVVPFVYALCASLKGNMLTIEGKLNEALAVYREALDLIEERGAQRFFLGGSTYAGLASVLRERDELREAEKRVGQGITLNSLWGNSSAVAYGLSVQARILIAQGRPGEAAKVLQEARGLAVGSDLYPEARSNLLRAEVELHLAEGDRETALHVAREQRLMSPEAQVPWHEQDQITYASALLEGGRMEEAISLLETTGQAAESEGRNGPLIAILNLQALAFRMQGQERAAEAVLGKSLELAAPQGYTRVFLDQGEDMRELLARINQHLHGDLKAYVDRLLNSFAGHRKPRNQREHTAPSQFKGTKIHSKG